MFKIIRFFLFLLPAEIAHILTLEIISKLISIPFFKEKIKKIYEVNQIKLEKNIFGLKFRNPLGLAAGFDKNAKYLNLWETLGFAFVEVGTITPKPQKGNPKPRLFRLKKDKALINRMGFNNNGVDKIIERLKNKPANLVIAANIGKNKNTPNNQAINDYLYCFKKLYNYVDFFVINVSSPNTPGLRNLQSKEYISLLFKEINNYREKQSKSKAVLLKISPDLNEDAIYDIVDLISKNNIEGLVVSNTTIKRCNLSISKNKINSIGNGGLSGAPIKVLSNNLLKHIKKISKDKFTIIGVGGIMNERDAIEKVKLGADLIEIYTGFVYEGPSLIKKILLSLLKYCK